MDKTVKYKFYRSHMKLRTIRCTCCVLQMEKFRSLFFEAESSQTKTAMVNNYRPPQPLGSRSVKSSVSTKDPHKDCERFGICAACSVQFTASLLSVMFALYYLVL